MSNKAQQILQANSRRSEKSAGSRSTKRSTQNPQGRLEPVPEGMELARIERPTNNTSARQGPRTSGGRGVSTQVRAGQEPLEQAHRRGLG